MSDYEAMFRTLFYATVNAEYSLQQAVEMLKNAHDECAKILRHINEPPDTMTNQNE